jgi:hypothetical protein
MHIQPEKIVIILAALVLIIRRVFDNKPFVQKHNNLIRVFIFVLLALALVLVFMKTKTYMVFVVVALGLAAMAKVMYDTYKKDREE